MQISVAVISLMELVDLIQEKNWELVSDSRGERNYVIWQQVTFKMG